MLPTPVRLPRTACSCRRIDLRLEEDSWSGYLTVRDPAFKQAMEARHYKYTWTENTDQAVRACNMTAGKIDLMVTTAGHI